MAKTLSEQWIEIVEQYCELHDVTEFVNSEVVAWAYDEGLWKPDRQRLVKVGSQELRSSLRETKDCDPQGRMARRFLSMSIGQQHLWCDKANVSYDFAVQHFRQREQGIIDDHESLVTDNASFNENNLQPGSPPIQMKTASRHLPQALESLRTAHDAIERAFWEETEPREKKLLARLLAKLRPLIGDVEAVEQ